VGKRGPNAIAREGRSQSYYLYRKITTRDTITQPEVIYHFPFVVGHFSFRTLAEVAIENVTNEKWKIRNGK
jgi:hypothetical protein